MKIAIDSHTVCVASLSDEGVKVLSEHRQSVKATILKFYPTADADGITKHLAPGDGGTFRSPLWEIMSIFGGDHLSLGGPIMFKRLETEEAKCLTPTT